MMTKSQWIENILAIVKQISDAEYQKRAWINYEFNYPCHFEEMISKLYDDGDLRNFIDNYSKKFTITEKQIESLKTLCKELDDYCDRPDIYIDNVSYKKFDEKKILSDPEWHKIRNLAKEVLKAFKS